MTGCSSTVTLTSWFSVGFGCGGGAAILPFLFCFIFFQIRSCAGVLFLVPPTTGFFCADFELTVLGEVDPLPLALLLGAVAWFGEVSLKHTSE